MGGVDYLVERGKIGRFLMQNFSSCKSLGVFQFTAVAPIRSTLGDRDHVLVLDIMTRAIHFLSPTFVRNTYLLGKILGFFSVHEAFSTLKMYLVTDMVKKSGLSWGIIEQKKVQEALKKGWMETGGGIVEFKKIDKKNKTIIFSFGESIAAAARSRGTPLCYYFELAILCGQVEYLMGGKWDGTETKCVGRGDETCIFEISKHKEDEQHPVLIMPKEEAEYVLDQYLEVTLTEEKDLKRSLKQDFGYMFLTQAFNYLFLSRSAGHVILMKYAGKAVGEKIARAKGLKDIPAAAEYLMAWFESLRMGLMEVEYCQEHLTVRLRESVFSAGVANIGMRLCMYSAGIIEGCFSAASGVKWTVEEDGCVASGDPCCTFVCATNDPEDLRKIVVR